MEMIDRVERLNRRQDKYEERLGLFSEAHSRRRDLFDRAHSIHEACELAGKHGVILRRNQDQDQDQDTTARIRTDIRPQPDEDWPKIKKDTNSSSGLIIIARNSIGEEQTKLMWDHQIDGYAKRHAKGGRSYKTPFGVANRALSLRHIDRQLGRFSDALDIVESAAMDPELNFEIAEKYREISSTEDLAPQPISQ
jgi:hypothetical protein